MKEQDDDENESFSYLLGTATPSGGVTFGRVQTYDRELTAGESLCKLEPLLRDRSYKHPAKLKHQEAWPAMLLERFLERGDPFDFLALMGLLSGARASQDLVGQEKDFRTYSSLPGFDAACRFLAESAFDAREASPSGRGSDGSPGSFRSDAPE